MARRFRAPPLRPRRRGVGRHPVQARGQRMDQALRFSQSQHGDLSAQCRLLLAAAEPFRRKHGALRRGGPFGQFLQSHGADARTNGSPAQCLDGQPFGRNGGLALADDSGLDHRLAWQWSLRHADRPGERWHHDAQRRPRTVLPEPSSLDGVLEFLLRQQRRAAREFVELCQRQGSEVRQAALCRSPRQAAGVERRRARRQRVARCARPAGIALRGTVGAAVGPSARVGGADEDRVGKVAGGDLAAFCRGRHRQGRPPRGRFRAR